MHDLGTGVPRCLGVAGPASRPKAPQALRCGLTPGLRISFGRVACMAPAPSMPGLWTLGFLLLCGASPPLFSFPGCKGGWFSDLSCRDFVVSAGAYPGLGAHGLCPPFLYRVGCVRGVLPSGGPLLPAACRWFRQGGPPVCFLKAPRVLPSVLSGLGVCPPPVDLVRGFAAVCLSHVPPPFFSGGVVCLFLPLPSLGWCTQWSAFGVANRVAVGACGRMGYVHAWPGGLSCRIRFWLCRLGGCARRFREALG